MTSARVAGAILPAVVHHPVIALPTIANHSTQRLVVLCLLAASALTLPPSGEGQTSDLQVQSVLGFADTFRLGYWAPLTVALSNTGSDRTGELQVRLRYGDALRDDVFVRTSYRHVSLSAGTRKRLRFTVLLESFAWPLEIYWVEAGREILLQSIDLRHKFTESRLLVVVSRDANLDYLNDAGSGHLRVLYPHPELLPDHWRGYDGVAGLILHGTSLETITHRQFVALRKWLMHGGRLAVSGGADFSLLRTPRLTTLLPAVPSGLVAVDDATPFGAASGDRLPLLDRYYVHRLTRVRGGVRFRSGELPLVVERALGAGSVVYLAFNVASQPFDRWIGMKSLWLDLLDLPAVPASLQRPEVRRLSPAPELLPLTGEAFPGHLALIALVLFYLAGLSTLFRFRPPRKSASARPSVLIVLYPLCMAPAALALFDNVLYPVGPTALLTAVVEPLRPAPFAYVQFDLAFFSNRNQALSVQLDHGDPMMLQNHREQRWGKRSDYRIDNAGTLSIERPGTFRMYMMQGDDVVPYDLEVSASRVDDRVSLSITNRSGQGWLDSWLISHDRVWRLGPLPYQDGKEQVYSLAGEGHPYEQESWRVVIRELASDSDPGDQFVNDFLVQSIWLRVARVTRNEWLLVSLVPSPLRLQPAGDDWRQHELALTVLPLPVPRAEDPGFAR